MTDNHLTPHDKFFRTTMVDPRVAREFFEQNLPDDIKAVINFATIQLQNESHIDDKLRLQITDLLYYAEFSGKPGYIYVLCEHQSRPHRLMPFRLIKYMIAIIEDHVKKTGDEILPVIYPCIFYTGDRNYDYSTDLFDLFGDNKELAKGILLQPYQLIDLSKIPDEKLKEFLRYGVIARTMKHIREKDFLVILRDIIGDLRAIEGFGEMDYIYTIISYIIKAGEIRDGQEFIKIIETGLTKISRGDIMTLAEQWKQEGYSKCMTLAEQWKQESLREGIEKGKQEAMEAIALRLFSQGQGFEQIAALTGLTPQQIKAIENKAKQS